MGRTRRTVSAVGLVGAALVLASCTADRGADAPAAPAPSSSAPSSSAPSSSASDADPTSDPTGDLTETPTQQPRPEPVDPGDLDASVAVGAVRHLAGVIGPREATGPGYRRAAGWVERQLTTLGYEVSRERVDVPAGVSWAGDPVPAGRSANLVASPPGLDPTAPHVVVGAHLDTVAGAPGAEDNASGVGVMLAVAEAVAERRTRLPVVLVAFGAEEPRGAGDALHHFGSQQHVAALPRAERRAVRGMVSLDRVGVGTVVPVGSASTSDPLQRSLVAAARRAGVPVVAEAEQRSSDHWSYVKAGMPAARLGSTPYAGYHSPGDVPAVVSRAQLGRVGRLVLAWLAPR